MLDAGENELHFLTVASKSDVNFPVKCDGKKSHKKELALFALEASICGFRSGVVGPCGISDFTLKYLCHTMTRAVLLYPNLMTLSDKFVLYINFLPCAVFFEKLLG